MNNIFFAALTVAAVIIIFGIICILANTRRLSKAGVALAGVVVLAIGIGLWIAYCAIPRQCHCANIIFILIGIVMLFALAKAVFDIIGKYILGVLLIIGAGYGLYWLFVNGVADNSAFGFVISIGAVTFALMVVYGVIRGLIAKAK